MAESQGGVGSSGPRRTKGVNAAKRAMAGATQEVSVTIPCGACRLLKKKCTSECIFAPYFGTEQGAASFAAVHKVFGASNVSKLLSNISPDRRHEAVATLSYEAQARVSDPVYGCVSTILDLQQQVVAMQAKLSMMQTQLMNRSFEYANAVQTTHQQQHQMLQQPNQQQRMQILQQPNFNSPQQQHQILQQPNFNIAAQPAYSNNSYASPNNPINVNNFNSGFDFTMETAPSSQSFEPFQNSWFPHYAPDD